MADQSNPLSIIGRLTIPLDKQGKPTFSVTATNGGGSLIVDIDGFLNVRGITVQYQNGTFTGGVELKKDAYKLFGGDENFKGFIQSVVGESPQIGLDKTYNNTTWHIQTGENGSLGATIKGENGIGAKLDIFDKGNIFIGVTGTSTNGKTAEGGLTIKPNGDAFPTGKLDGQPIKPNDDKKPIIDPFKPDKTEADSNNDGKTSPNPDSHSAADPVNDPATSPPTQGVAENTPPPAITLPEPTTLPATPDMPTTQQGGGFAGEPSYTSAQIQQLIQLLDKGFKPTDSATWATIDHLGLHDYATGTNKDLSFLNVPKNPIEIPSGGSYEDIPFPSTSGTDTGDKSTPSLNMPQLGGGSAEGIPFPSTSGTGTGIVTGTGTGTDIGTGGTGEQCSPIPIMPTIHVTASPDGSSPTVIGQDPYPPGWNGPMLILP